MGRHGPVPLFPHWVVKWIREPYLKTEAWLKRPVEVFHVPPKMTKFEIKEYLTKLYGLKVSKVHTAIYNGRRKLDQATGRKRKEADYKKAYVYLADEQGKQGPRYHRVEEALQPEAQAAWPEKPPWAMAEYDQRGAGSSRRGRPWNARSGGGGGRGGPKN